MNHSELGIFLRTRREALRPADVGLATGGRRRTPGLRRTEVALLADISVDYYERLEQARAGHPSDALLASLARALRLSLDERDYLYALAGRPPPAQFATDGYVEPGVLFLLDSLVNVPAHVVDGMLNIVAQNALSVALFGPWAQQKGRQANAVWRWFSDPAKRVEGFLEDDPATGRQYVAGLRAVAALRGHDAVVQELVSDLGTASAEFTEYWNEMAVEPIRSTDKTLFHPRFGRFDVHCDAVFSAVSGHRLIVLRPQASTGTAERFKSIGATCSYSNGHC